MPDVTRLLFEARRWGRREKFTQAIRLYEQVLQVEPKNLEALVGIGGCYYKLDQLDEARRYWESALRQDPRNQKIREFLDKLDRGSNITLPTPSSVTMAKQKKKAPDGHSTSAENKKSGFPGSKLPLLIGGAIILLLLLGASIAFFLASGGGDSAGETIANRPVIADTLEPGAP
jgi:tetratricopeptide (TPR) repeat protein